MGTAEERAALRAALEAVEAAIVQTQAALRLASSVDEFARLNATLVSLKATRTNLELQLLNLTAAVEAAVPSAARTKKLDTIVGGLKESQQNRAIVELTLERSDHVLRQVSDLEKMLKGANPTRDLIADLGE